MAEKLAILRKNGGGTIDLLNPDVVRQTDVATTTNVTIAVTKKPKYIIYVYGRQANTTDRSGIVIYDVLKEDTTAWVYSSNGYLITPHSTGGYIQSVSDTSVVVRNPNSWAVRLQVLIYY